MLNSEQKINKIINFIFRTTNVIINAETAAKTQIYISFQLQIIKIIIDMDRQLS